MSKKSVSGSVPPASEPVPKYQPTPQEREVVAAYYQRRKQHPSTPRLTMEKIGDDVSVGLSHPDQETASILMMALLGTLDSDFADGLIGQLVNAGAGRDGSDARGPNFLLGAIKGIGPRDEVESMLTAQLAVTHTLAMRFGRGLAIADTVQKQDAAERAFTKLTRSFVAQVEGLKRYRSTGEQKIQVSHVVVANGGQAVLGNISVGPGGGDGSRKAETTP